MSYTLFHRTLGPLDPKGLNGKLLIQRYCSTGDPAIRDLAIEEFIPLVDHILQQVFLPSNNAITRADLRQSGLKGLITAFNRFDFNKENRFSTFAYKHIYGAMIDCLRQVRVLPRNVFNKVAELSKAVEDLSQKLKHEPEEFEICDTFNITPEELSNLLLDTYLTLPMFSLDDPVIGASDYSYIDLIEDKKTHSPEEIFFIKEDINHLKDEIQRLSSRERLITSFYYYEGLTLDKIGQILNISESGVFQVLKRARAKLRVELESTLYQTVEIKTEEKT